MRALTSQRSNTLSLLLLGCVLAAQALRQDTEVGRLEQISAGDLSTALEGSGNRIASSLPYGSFATEADAVAKAAPQAKPRGRDQKIVSQDSSANGATTVSLLQEGADTAMAASGNQTLDFKSCKVIGCGKKGQQCSCRDFCIMHDDCCYDYGAMCPYFRKTANEVGVYRSTQAAKFWFTAFVTFVALVVIMLISEKLFFRKNSKFEDVDTFDDEPRAVTTAASERGTNTSFTQSEVTDYTLDLNWFSIRFKDAYAEKEWKLFSEQSKISTAALALAFMTVVLVMFRIYHYRVWAITPCLGDFSILVGCSHVAFLVGIFALSIAAYRKQEVHLYRYLIAFFFFYVPATSLPPFAWSCSWLKDQCNKPEFNAGVRQAYENVDCSMQGHTATQLMLTWILLQPWICLRLDHMHIVWFWIVGIYLGWTFQYRYFMEDETFDMNDIVVRTILLIVALVMSIANKYRLEKAHRLKFLQELQHKASSQKIFRILEYMVPPHVVGRMMENMVPNAIGQPKEIADQVNCVSILFVLINDFDQFAKTKTPNELLKFLNFYFTKMDEICDRAGVTKIETVMEEYVACVGVLPQDVKENDQHGHGALLQRLFKAGGEILALESDEDGDAPAVKFKMGVHTGPIVAGVIGTKLPRFRLFGDTINSAARMMQKGLPGQLQFGEATHKALPGDVKAAIKYRGKVAMKGKGDIDAWTYEPNEEEVQMGRQMTSAEALAGKVSSSASRPPPRLTKYGSTGGCHLKCMAGALLRLGAKSEEERALKVATVDPIEAQFDKRFEAAINRAASQKATAGIILPHKAGFTEEMEEEWNQQFHERNFSSQATWRIGITVVLIMLASAVDFWFIFSHQIWVYPHPIYHSAGLSSRPLVYFYTRGAVVLVLVLWWLSVDSLPWVIHDETQKDKRRIRRKWIEDGIVATIVVSIIAVFISYDALIYSDTQEYRKFVNEHSNFRAPDDQSPTLFFVIMMMSLMGMLPVKFYSSLYYLVSSFFCIGLHRFYGWCNPEARPWENIFSDEGEFLFIVLTIMIIITCHEDENGSRARYKAHRAVLETQDRTQYILKTLMPQLVVQELGHPLALIDVSHKYRHVTIAQSDLCGFTALASNKTPREVVGFMGELFGAFDKLTDKWSVYKVETIGDAYIAAMGERPLTEINLPCNVVLFGLDMVRAVDKWASKLGVAVACRVGVHYGECVGGIVGNTMQRYHLFGDLMTIMDALEATSLEGRVQMSTACKNEVERHMRDDPKASSERLTFQERNDIEVLETSKGDQHTFDSVGGTTYLVESDRPLRGHASSYFG